MLTKTKSRFLSGKHLKTTLLAFTLLFSVNALMARQKYDYAVISIKIRELFVAINGEEFKQIEVSKDEFQHNYFDPNPALTQVNKMEEEGWELFDTEVYFAGSAPDYAFFMRRKEVTIQSNKFRQKFGS